jgi:two-component system nitrogen regulation response regulator GlnG
VAEVDAAVPPADPLDGYIADQLRRGTVTLYDDVIQQVERKVISAALRSASGNQVEAARVLGITRTTLRSKIQKLGIRIDRTVETGE